MTTQDYKNKKQNSFNFNGSSLRVKVTRGQVVQLVFFCVQFAERPPEDDAADPSNTSHYTIIPHQIRITRER
jgi:hypothetical protein